MPSNLSFSVCSARTCFFSSAFSVSARVNRPARSPLVPDISLLSRSISCLRRAISAWRSATCLRSASTSFFLASAVSCASLSFAWQSMRSLRGTIPDIAASRRSLSVVAARSCFRRSALSRSALARRSAVSRASFWLAWVSPLAWMKSGRGTMPFISARSASSSSFSRRTCVSRLVIVFVFVSASSFHAAMSPLAPASSDFIRSRSFRSACASLRSSVLCPLSISTSFTFAPATS
mmetsp:Transcript_29749/g.71544  ORF Transcript_29749/g.71544 Transcript_29749/m.71544 type:complete len:235 (+) Transcript_29749:1234-1938(+)